MANSGMVGMPIARKAREKYDCMFLSFTNSLLIAWKLLQKSVRGKETKSL